MDFVIDYLSKIDLSDVDIFADEPCCNSKYIAAIYLCHYNGYGIQYRILENWPKTQWTNFPFLYFDWTKYIYRVDPKLKV